MATPTYEQIASITLSSTASSVTFSSIPQDYRDLVIAVNTGLGAGGTGFFARLNGDSGTNYSYVRIFGDGSSGVSNSASGLDELNIEAGSMVELDNSFIINIMDYSATDKHKTVLSRNNQNFVGAYANRWADTSAVTSIVFYTTTVDLLAGSTFALWGIAA